MKTSYRSHTCGELNETQVNQTVTLCGFIHKIRSFGGLTFIDLKDRYGITQLVIDPKEVALEDLHMQDVLQAEGMCLLRKDVNVKIPTGQIEIHVAKIQRLSSAKTPPFELTEENINENLRLKYRYLDIRRGKILHHLHVRHKTILEVRNFLDSKGFLEIETPILAKSTPEGARDFLVPSRVHPHSFYALPQSPQQFKQLLMVSGVDRYFQIAKCFRDEDLRADRQIEFSQIDIEMSFATPKDLFSIMENMMEYVLEKILHTKVQTPFMHLTYQECMENYGSDKPDLRYEAKYFDLSDIFAQSSFQVFADLVKEGGKIKAIKVEKGAVLSRKQIDGYQKLVQEDGIKGLAFLKKTHEGISSPIAKFLSEEQMSLLLDRLHMQEEDILLFVAGKEKEIYPAMDHLRRQLAIDFSWIEQNKFAFAWVEEFPLFEYDEEEKRLYSMHHPFTQPLSFDTNEPLKMISTGYDLILNGYELGGGSVRIHDPDAQRKIFELLGLSNETIDEKFGPFLEALSYGAPPHLGIAFGLDRLIMILTNTTQIRDVIAFPKTTSAQDLTIDCPSNVEKSQLDELNITLS